MNAEQVEGLNAMVQKGFTVSFVKTKSDPKIVIVTVTREKQRASFADAFDRALDAAIAWAKRLDG